jgi:hypothetical protein
MLAQRRGRVARSLLSACAPHASASARPRAHLRHRTVPSARSAILAGTMWRSSQL